MADEALIARLDALIGVGERLAQVESQGGSYPRAFHSEYRGWRTQSAACLLQVVGAANPYYERFVDDTAEEYPGAAGGGAAILSALRSDIEAGFLRRQSDLVAAEVFTDFLDMAGHLLEKGYYHPAAMLIGAVAEDGLRRIARNNDIGVADRDDMNSLNSKLREAGVYSPLIAKHVTLWADIRNKADHGEFEQVMPGDVAEMYSAVTAFLAERIG